MRKIILEPKGQYDRGTYTIKSLCGTSGSKWDDRVVWDYQKNGVVADLKAEGFKIFEPFWRYDKDFKEIKEYKEIK